MNVTRKPKTTPAEMPSAHQIIALAIAKAEYQLSNLIKVSRNDENWDDCDVDVDNAVELALRQILRMKEMDLCSGYAAFSCEWFCAASALNLAVKVFSRTDCTYQRALQGTCEMFSELAKVVEFAEHQPSTRT